MVAPIVSIENEGLSGGPRVLLVEFPTAESLRTERAATEDALDLLRRLADTDPRDLDPDAVVAIFDRFTAEARVVAKGGR